MHGARLRDDSREASNTGFMTLIRNDAINDGVPERQLFH